MLSGIVLAAMAVADQLTSDASSSLLQYGALGVVTLALGLFAWRVIFAALAAQRKAYEREVARADKAESQLDALHREVRDKTMPALAESTRAGIEAARAVADVTALLRERR